MEVEYQDNYDDFTNKNIDNINSNNNKGICSSKSIGFL